MNKVIRQGETLKINGSNLYPSADTVVYWNSIASNNLAEIVTPPDYSSISVRVPPNLPNNNKVIICNSVGCHTGIQDYTFVGFPDVEHVSHSHRDWGKEVLLKGNHLKDVTGVSLEDNSGRVYSVDFNFPSEKSLIFYMPDDFSEGTINLLSRVGGLSMSSVIHGTIPSVQGSIDNVGNHYYGDNLIIKGKALQKVNRIKLEGLNEDIYVNENQITHLGSTGVSFLIPEGVKELSTVYLQNQSGQYVNGVYNSTVHEEFGVYPLNIKSPHINSINKLFGQYNEEVIISGINLSQSKILFLDFNSEYVEASEGATGQYYKTVRVPKNVRNDRILASGYQSPCSGKSFSSNSFYPLPTIESISTGTWKIGETVTINAVNAFDAFGVVAVTGNNLINGNDEIGYASNEQNLSSYNHHLGVLSFDNSSMVGDAASGHTIISAVINPDFIGQGHPFLISKHQIQNENSIRKLKENMDLYNIKSNIPFISGERVTINGKAPEIVSLTPNRASASGKVTVSGNYFLGATGVQLSGSNQIVRVPPIEFEGYAEANRGVFISNTGAANNYEQLHYINLDLSDFNFTQKQGTLKVLTPS